MWIAERHRADAHLFGVGSASFRARGGGLPEYRVRFLLQATPETVPESPPGGDVRVPSPGGLAMGMPHCQDPHARGDSRLLNLDLLRARLASPADSAAERVCLAVGVVVPGNQLPVRQPDT